MENTQPDKKFSLSGSFQKGLEYAETKLKLLSLKLTERSSRLIASLLVDVTKAVLVLFVVFFFSLALGFYLSELLNSYSLGFLTTGGLFVVLILIISVLEPHLERKLMDLSIRKFLRKWADENDDEAKDEVKNQETVANSAATEPGFDEENEYNKTGSQPIKQDEEGKQNP